MLFQDASEAGVREDYRLIIAYLAGFQAQHRPISTSVDLDKVMSVLRYMRQDFPHKDGILAASPFKLAANFACNWVARKPVLMDPEPFPYVNGVLALEIVRDSLHHATIKWGDGTVKS